MCHAFNFLIVLVYDDSFVQALWQLLWVNPLTQPSTGKSVSNNLSKKNPVGLIQNRAGVVVAELLSQVIVHFMAMLTASQYNLAKVFVHFSFCYNFSAVTRLEQPATIHFLERFPSWYSQWIFYLSGDSTLQFRLVLVSISFWMTRLISLLPLLILFSFLQAIAEGTRANYILMHAPFLIPFTSRVKIFTVSGC